MAYNTLAHATELYSNRSMYADNQSVRQPRDSLLQWPLNGHFDRFKADAMLLAEALTSYCSVVAPTVTDQVFGNQARQQSIALRHSTNILYERALLRNNRVKDIDRRLLEFIERLSIVKMHFPIDGGKTQQNLERLIIELEKQRHEEDLAFWKDSAEIRKDLFAEASTYSATQHRKDILCGVEDGYGR